MIIRTFNKYIMILSQNKVLEVSPLKNLLIFADFFGHQAYPVNHRYMYLIQCKRYISGITSTGTLILKRSESQKTQKSLAASKAKEHKLDSTNPLRFLYDGGRLILVLIDHIMQELQCIFSNKNLSITPCQSQSTDYQQMLTVGLLVSIQ